MPSFNEGAERAGDVDKDTWSHRIKDEYRDRIPHLENFEELKMDMEDRGLDEPVRIGYDPPGTRETQRLNEGNHRLAAARELGLDAIPVRIQLVPDTGTPIQKLVSPLEIDDAGMRVTLPSGEVVRHPTPSQVGMPTASGVARETGETAAASLDEVVTLFDPNPGYMKPSKREVMTHEAFKEYWDEGFLGGPGGEAMSLGVEGPSTAYNMLAGQGVPEDQIAAFYLYVGQSRSGWWAKDFEGRVPSTGRSGFPKQGFRNGKDISRLSDDELQLRYGMYLEDRAAAASTAAAKVEREAAEKAASKTAKETAAKAEAEAAPLKPAQEAMRDAVPEGKVLADLEGHEVFEDSHGAPGTAGYTRSVGDGQYVDTVEVRLPPKFIEDHTSRGLGGGVEVKSMKNASVRRLTAADIVEIYSDADYYSDAETAAEMGLRGLAGSARATMKALKKALGVPEGAPFPSRAEIEATLAAMGG